VVNQNTKDTKEYYGADLPYAKILSGSVPTPASAKHFVATVNELFKMGKMQAAQ
jgi:hypothetical protein